jgi:RNA polymerase sigma-70 factor, ECF subfamily
MIRCLPLDPCEPADAAPAGTVSGATRAAAPGALPAEWFRDHVQNLWRFVLRLGVPRHAIDDLVQEAFIIATRRRADIGPGQERSFLLATAVRLSSNYRQRAYVRREVSHGDGFEHSASPHPNAEQLLIEKRSRELLDQVLAELSDPHRAVFVLFELEGFSVPEIAELLQLPLGTVSSRLWRARAKFSESAALLQRRIEMENP